MGDVLQRAWLRRGFVACVLWPVSLLFGAIATLRRIAYRCGIFSSSHPGVPVIVVGNVTAGGSGKTPIVQAMVRHLLARGIAVGIVSRGHGRVTTGCREVHADAQARDAGDEPLLLKRSCDVPVFVAKRRIDAARALLAAYPGTQVLVCDDGLQHYALARDMEICVFDARGVGNRWLLPAGPLREPWPRAVDFVLRAGPAAGLGGYEVRRQIAGHALRGDGSRAELAALRGRPINAVAGIANPEAFFSMLRAAGLTLARAIALPDHHDFQRETFLPEGQLLCTEKDAVKLWAVRADALAVPLLTDIDPAFWQAFDARLDAKLSSPDGPQTA